jgi:hypothetical protein
VRVDVVLYRTDTGDALATYGTSAPTWRKCVEMVLSWIQIEIAPCWPAGALRLSPCAGTDPYVAAALYGIGRSWRLIEPLDHDWLPPYPVQTEPT